MPRKIIARFPTLIEAQAAVTCLEVGGVPAMVDNATIGAMMPHASNAFGGFLVSIDSEDQDAALSLLTERAKFEAEEEPESPVPEPSTNQKFRTAIRRATYGAVFSVIFLPVIGNAFSVYMYVKAFRLSSDLFWKSRAHLLIGLLFNALGIGFGISLLSGVIR